MTNNKQEMKIESLNCPNCGAGVSSDKTRCLFCHSRLKTVACPSCLGLLFAGSRHCPHCGVKTVEAHVSAENLSGECPRCRVPLHLLEIDQVMLRECRKCDGLWADARTFEEICADRESQAAVLGFFARRDHPPGKIPVQYVPCPDCRQLMNRHNFGRSSGVIIDICKRHGVWLDIEELPRIIEFIRQGGLDRAREKEKLYLEERRQALRDEQRRTALLEAKYIQPDREWNTSTVVAIREFINFLFE